jgi:hypothetical protein
MQAVAICYRDEDYTNVWRGVLLRAAPRTVVQAFKPADEGTSEEGFYPLRVVAFPTSAANAADMPNGLMQL